ncbi:hypothetical protein H1O16_gp095 [Burkholderia phage BcepSaruman]|uniref:Uncharacterized protein n=1 Tax=Burkholderia phage BcepSaruman TaxID=2530032 RepID=A0A4D5ZHG9_9CAUD|nr:hypothetical protein H1O16_gp095 [Burkholderia phage BcepSaruman]QBX06508.1 hypothetical protein BcepSaruman_095 [Burkholderia phage BcepSaruman]
MAKPKTYQEPRACTLELPKFRYLDDVSRYLDKLRDDVSESENLIRVQQQAVAYLTKPKENVTASLRGASVDATIKRVVVPHVKKLDAQYGTAEEIYDQYRALEAVEAQVALQFPDRRGEVAARVQQVLAELKAKGKDQIRRVLEFLSAVAHQHVPEAFDHVRQALAQELENHVRCAGTEQFLYVNVDASGSLVFTSYTMLSGAQADDGRRVPTLYVSLQWVLGSGYFVQINQEFCAPDSLERTTPLQDVQQVCEAAASMLADEGFDSPLGSDLPPALK